MLIVITTLSKWENRSKINHCSRMVACILNLRIEKNKRIKGIRMVAVSMLQDSCNCYWFPWMLVTAWNTALHPDPVLFTEVT